jgi:hypothetical protein
MELLVRSKCHHRPGSDTPCTKCYGVGYNDRWLHVSLLDTLPNATWIIVARRGGRTAMMVLSA